MEKQITGVMMYYYYVCKRKLWYFYYDIQMEQGNENVAIGKILDENSYKREEKHINIDNVINIDFLRTQGILHEVKKSNKIEEASIWQVKYYLYYLKQHDVVIKAKIDYPLLKQTVDVELEEADVEVIEKTLESIREIVSKDKPPVFSKLSICKNCAYHDLCMI
ncbi:CRISPR-associated protein Cas4 [Anaerosporobacter sp.]|uniref:CRISPR-associated protein Cas4 n=1 Tax=Anaerosporobacter sp. TaxID=1872529 RepID=UPI00286F89C6|nr:CRISPR-associated protein Cas4 [Anaerosporobacter sp.]